jgi:hypothetical protein
MTSSATRVAWRIRTRRGNEGGVDREASDQNTTGLGCLYVRSGGEGEVYTRGMSRLSSLQFSRVYPLYVAKLARKGRSRAELDEVIRWLTGYDDDAVSRHLESESTFEQFFAEASLNPAASSITGVICGVRVEDIEDSLEQRIRYLDKLVDELARGKAMAKVLRD